MGNSGKYALAIGAAGATAGSIAALRRIDKNWAATPDIVPTGERALPHGRERTVRTDDGAELAVTVAGPTDTDAPTVVLAHGWTNGRRVWAPVAHELIRRGRRVVLYDQRGHGHSTVGGDGFTIERLGGDLRAVLEDVDADLAVLVGHSMGGMTIQSLATHHPEVVDERVDGIVLVATAASGLGRGDARSDAGAAKLIEAKLLDRVLRTKAGVAFFRGAVGRHVRKADLLLMQEQLLATAPGARSGWLTAMLGMDLRQGIATIGVEVTILVGSEDKLTPPDRADELAAAIPGARLVRLDGLGHMLPLEAPTAVAEAVTELRSIGQTVRSPA